VLRPGSQLAVFAAVADLAAWTSQFGFIVSTPAAISFPGEESRHVPRLVQESVENCKKI